MDSIVGDIHIPSDNTLVKLTDQWLIRRLIHDHLGIKCVFPSIIHSNENIVTSRCMLVGKIGDESLNSTFDKQYEDVIIKYRSDASGDGSSIQQVICNLHTFDFSRYVVMFEEFGISPINEYL